MCSIVSCRRPRRSAALAIAILHSGFSGRRVITAAPVRCARRCIAIDSAALLRRRRPCAHRRGVEPEANEYSSAVFTAGSAEIRTYSTFPIGASSFSLNLAGSATIKTIFASLRVAANNVPNLEIVWDQEAQYRLGSTIPIQCRPAAR